MDPTTILILLTNVGSMVLGMFLGQLFEWENRTIKGQKVSLPRHLRHVTFNNIVATLVIMIAIATMVQGVIYQRENSKCLASWQETLKVRGSLWAKEDTLIEEDLENIEQILRTSINEPQDAALIQAQFNKFIEDRVSNDIERKRLANIRENSTYPIGTCG